MPSGLLVVGLGLPLVALARRRRGAAALGSLWTFASLLPFGWPWLVPANGRYAYLAAAGLALLVMALLISLPEKGRAAVCWAAAALLAIGCTVRFLELREAHLEATRLAEHLRSTLAEATAADCGRSVAVAGPPKFVHDRSGAPLAQVFHWGLADATRPPFSPPCALVYPLTEGVVESTAPITGRADGPLLLRWQSDAQRWQSSQPDRQEPSSPAVPFAGEGPAEGAAWRAIDRAPTIAWTAERSCDYRLVVLTEANAGTAPVVEARHCAGGRCEVSLPHALLATAARLYDGPAYWWLEWRGCGEGGGTTLARRLELLD